MHIPAAMQHSDSEANLSENEDTPQRGKYFLFDTFENDVILPTNFHTYIQMLQSMN